MPDMTAKYLNKSGLEDYNELLPHSATQMQEYVSDWLDEHPEATTTVEDNSITTPKLQDGCVTEPKLSGSTRASITNKATLGYTIYSDMLEPGRIDDSGQPVSHNSRCRTKDYMPVSAGDLAIVKYDTTNDRGVMFSYYDSTKAFISNSSWYYFNQSGNFVIPITQDGYFKLTFNTADTSLCNGYVSVVTRSTSYKELLSIQGKIGYTSIPVPSAAMLSGNWNANGTHGNNNTRVGNIDPILLHKGDEVHFTKKGDFLVDFGFSSDGGTSITFRGYSNMPFIAPNDGLLYFNIKKSDNSAITDFSTWDKAITIERFADLPQVRDIRTNELFNGYVTDDGSISAHAKRLVNWNPIHAKKGDVIRINDMRVMAQYFEFSEAKTLITKTSTYYTPKWVGGNYKLCGDYVVQNDCWIMAVMAPIEIVTGETVPDTFAPADHDCAVSVIHVEVNRNANTSDGTMFRLPKAARKAKRLNTAAIVSQAATFINGNLWAAVDGENDYFQVINPTTGAIERTISHDLGHCNCLDYCAETDTLLTMDSIAYNKILLYPNVSQATSNIAKSDCIVVELDASDIDYAGTACFGQDSREVLLFTGKGSDAPFNLYKIVLGYADGEYTGTYDGLRLYTGIIRDNIDTYVAGSTNNYAQDSCYDGYFYLAYGTGGNNFLAIDLDDNRGTYRVVGNYLHHEYNSNYVELYPEPEGVCLYDGNIWCLSRENNAQKYYFNIFDR